MATITTNDSRYQTSAYHRASAQRRVIRNDTKAAHVTAWTLQVFLGVAFLFFGTMKLGGAEKMVQLFQTIGFGQWLRYVTGTVEFVSAILLFTPPTAAVGAFLLASTMAGAILTHIFVIGSSPVLPVIFFLLSVALVALRWNRVRVMMRQENVVNV